MQIKIEFSKYPYGVFGNHKTGSITESVTNWVEALDKFEKPVGKKVVNKGIIRLCSGGNLGPCVYKKEGTSTDNMLSVNEVTDGRNIMTTWLRSQLSRHTVRQPSDTYILFESETAEEFESNNYLVLRNVVLIPSANPDRKVAEGEDEETTFSKQIDILAWDGDCLWIVECKHKLCGERDIDRTVEQINGHQLHLQSFLEFIKERENLPYLPPVKPWLVNKVDENFALEHPCDCTKIHEHFPTCTKIPKLEQRPAPPAFWHALRGLCPKEKLTFKERIEFVAMVRDYRTKGLCLTENRGIGEDAKALRREITGCAGAGKSVLLCFNAWQVSVNKAVINGRIGGETGNQPLSAQYQSAETIYLIAPEQIHVQVLKEIMATIRGKGLFGSEQGKPMTFMTVVEFLSKEPQGEFAVFLDEAQDLDEGTLSNVNKHVEGTLLCYALDRLQTVKKEVSDVRKILCEESTTQHINLSIQYRQPVPLYFASLALAYRWNSSKGDIYLQLNQPLKDGATTLLEDIWGIYNCFGADKKALSPYWSQTVEKPVNPPKPPPKTENLVNKLRAAWNEPIKVTRHYRLSLRCDVHPASYWLQDNGSSYCLRFEVDDALESVAPRVISAQVPSCEDGLAAYSPYGSGGADVLWVRFSRDANAMTLRAKTLQICVPVGMKADGAYAGISKQIMGREWPVVVIDGEPLGYATEDGDERIVASQLMYLIASRATTALYMIDNASPSREEFERLKAKEAAKCTDYNPTYPGYLDAEFEQNVGLRWGRRPSEPAAWWHLSWKYPEVSRVKELFGLNPVHDNPAK